MKTMYAILLFLFVVAGATTFNQYQVHGAFNLLYVLVIFFLSLNLFVNFLEFVLFFKKDYIRDTSDKLYNEPQADKSTPIMSFLNSKLTLSRLFSASHWADAWVGYSMFDRSYSNHKSFGFAADIGNGFSTVIPSIILHIGFTYHFLDANVLGMIMLAVMWQMAYGTFVYWFSFIVNGRQKLLTTQQNFVFILGNNVPWVIFTFIGIYAAIQLILDNNFSVFGL